jgi:uncharacterized protein
MNEPHAADPLPTAPAEVIAAVYECFGRGDMPGLLAFVADDVDWGSGSSAPDADLVPMLARGRGHGAVAHYFSGVADLAFERFEPIRFLVDGDVVLTELAVEVVHRGTGKRLAFGEIHHFTVRDGKVVRYSNFVDTAALIELYRP